MPTPKQPTQKTTHKSALSVARERAKFPIDAKMGDILEMRMLLTDMQQRDGDNGTYYIIGLTSLATQQKYRVMTGSVAVCEVLNALTDDDLPLEIAFEQRGRGYYVMEDGTTEEDLPF